MGELECSEDFEISIGLCNSARRIRIISKYGEYTFVVHAYAHWNIEVYTESNSAATPPDSPLLLILGSHFFRLRKHFYFTISYSQTYQACKHVITDSKHMQ